MTLQERTELESAQRSALAAMNAGPAEREALEQKHGQVWDSDELRRDFEVLEFSAPVVIVRRKADGALGSLFFRHSPRFYFNFQKDDGR